MRSRTTPIPFCRVVAVTVLVAGAALLVGCSPEPGTAPSPPTTSPRATASAAASPAPSPTPTPTMPAPAPSPTPPPEMSRDDEVGAVAAATYFLTELYTYTLTSQDTTAWLAMSHAECLYCKSVVSTVDAERAAEVITTPGSLAVTSNSAEASNPLVYGVKLDISVGRAVQRSRLGVVLGDVQPEEVTMGAVVVWQVDRWIVRGVDVLAAEESR